MSVMQCWPRPSLTPGQWCALRSISDVASLRVCDLDCMPVDVSRLTDEKLVRIFGLRIRMTLLGAAALWYHRAN